MKQFDAVLSVQRGYSLRGDALRDSYLYITSQWGHRNNIFTVCLAVSGEMQAAWNSVER